MAVTYQNYSGCGSVDDATQDACQATFVMPRRMYICVCGFCLAGDEAQGLEN